MMTRRDVARLLWVAPCALAVTPLRAQSQSRESAARGLYNWVHTTGDAERAFEFYRDVFGAELENSPFAPATPSAPRPRIRSVAEAGSDALVWDLTDTHGSRFRTAFMRTPNTPFGLELSEFFDIERDTRQANPWDPGASMLIFTVRRLDEVIGGLARHGTSLLSLGGRPVETAAGRSMLIRDPDGYLIRVTEALPHTFDSSLNSNLLHTAIGVSVANTRAALEFYVDLLGFSILHTRQATESELRLNGLSSGALTQTTLEIAGTGTRVELLEFSALDERTPPAQAFRWRIQDIGAPQFQLHVADLDSLLEKTRHAGYRFLSVGGMPIQRPFGRFVFAIDPDGVLVEFVEPAN